ncbi:MAG: winged helix-turn-helix transcriptional regulator [Actinobacteria bacterium]|nr:winged helix-turn-helix transcriptional regulator [Actinomycetota bacterium]
MGEEKVAAERRGGAAEAELLVALRHELRRKILRAMFEEDGAISPRRLSKVLKEPLSNVSYHVRVLADCAAVALVDQKPVRGSMQHFYSPTVERPWALEMLGVGADGSVADAEGDGGRRPSEGG